MLRWRLLLVVLVLLLVVGQPVLTGRGRRDRIVLGRSYMLGQGRHIAGDLVVFGGDVEMAPGSRIDGSVLALGGSIRSAGRVDGQAMAPSGSVQLLEGALVGGDVLAAGNVARVGGAAIGGRMIAGYGLGISLPLIGLWPGRFPIGFPGFWFGWPWGVGLVGNASVWAIQVLLGALVWFALGLLVILLAPRRVCMTGQTLVRHPWQSILFGLLTAAVLLVAAVPLLIVTCIGIPIAFAAVAGLAAAALFGSIAVGVAVGEWALRSLRLAAGRQILPMGAGLAILATALSVPYLGPLAAALMGLWGLGATALTRFGAVPYSAQEPRVTRRPPS